MSGTGVLAVTSSYPLSPDDSTAPFIREISRGLAARGFEVDLVLPHHPGLDWEGGDPPLRLHPYRYLPGNSQAWHVWGHAGALHADVRLRPRTLAVLPLAAGAGLLAIRSWAKRRRPAVLHAHWVVPSGALSALVARRSAIPLVVSLHGSGVFLAERNTLVARAARLAFDTAAAVTACSADLAERAIRLGARPEKVSVIPYGVDTERFRPPREGERAEAREELGVAPGATVVLAIGRLVRKKGFHVLLRALRDVPPEPGLEVLVAGEGDEEGALRALAGHLGGGTRIRFLGALGRDRLRRLLWAGDVLAVPSVHDERGNVDGLPNVLLEGLSAGLPVVATDVGGIPSVVRDGREGLLVPEGDASELGRALARVVRCQDFRRPLGEAGRRAAVERLGWTAAMRQYSRILSRVASVPAP